MEVKRITVSLSIPSHWPIRLPNGVPKDQKLSPNGIPNWMWKDFTEAVYRNGPEKSTKNTPKLSSKWLSPWSGPPRPYKIPHQGMTRSAYTIYKAAFREQKRATITVSMTTYCEAYMLGMDQGHTTHAWFNWRILPPSNGHQQVKYGNWWLWQCQERKLTLLHKVKTRRRCNDVKIESIGTPHMIGSEHAEPVKTRRCCNDVTIERIGTPHMTVCQHAEQARIDIRQQAMQKDDWSRCYGGILSPSFNTTFI